MCHLLPITTVPPEIAALRGRALGDTGYSECLFLEPAPDTHGNLHGRSPEAIETLLHGICAKKPLTSRKAERRLPKGFS